MTARRGGQILAEAKSTDASEDATEAVIEAQDVADAADATGRADKAQAAAREGRMLTGPRPAKPHAALARAGAEHAAAVVAAERKAAHRAGQEAAAAATNCAADPRPRPRAIHRGSKSGTVRSLIRRDPISACRLAAVPYIESST